MGRRRRGTNKKKADGGGGAKQTEGHRPGGGSTVETDVAGMIENHGIDYVVDNLEVSKDSKASIGADDNDANDAKNDKDEAETGTKGGGPACSNDMDLTVVNYTVIDKAVQGLKEKRSVGECPLCLEPTDTIFGVCFNCGTQICEICQQKRDEALIKAIAKEGGVVDRETRRVALPEGKQLDKAVEQLVFCCPICRFDSSREGTKEKALLENVSKGRAWAQCLHGIRLLEDGYGDNQAGIDFLNQAAEQGCTDAMFYLGSVYYKGVFGIEKSVEETKRYLHRASDLGHSEGSMTLSEIYRSNGDVRISIEYLKIAAEQGDASAHYNLVAVYAGEEKMSLYHLFVGAELGDVKCQSALGDYCGTSLCIRYWTMAAEQNHFESICSLALYLLQNNDDHEGRFGGSFSEGLLWGRMAVGLNEWESSSDKIFFEASLESMEEKARLGCFNCGSSAFGKNTSFGRCTQCACAYYCGRSCQVQHWRNGHKTKCCSFNAKKDFGTIREFIESNDSQK